MNMKKYLVWTVAITLSYGLLSCSSSDEVDPEDLDGSKTIVSMLEKTRVQLTPEQQVFANDNNKFTLNFLKTVNETDRSGRSFVYSPLSITYVLGMVNDAAEGITEQELEQTLGFHEGGIQAVNDFCKNLIDNLPKVDKTVQLNIANAIFLNQKYTLNPQFQQDMEQYYDAKAEALDFSSPQTLGIINGWCDEKTQGMVPTILDSVEPFALSYLLNAVYFKADWTSKFSEKNTRVETFAGSNGNTRLPLMHQTVLMSYLKNETYSAVSIPYGNQEWSMIVMLPEEGKTTDDVINHIAANGLVSYNSADMTDVFRAYEVDLKLPRFESNTDTNDLEEGLIGLLQQLGIRRVFTDFAEIPNMCGAPVYISMMRQKAKIKVSEEGSEAAAVTVAEISFGSVGAPPVYPKATFHVNRPFVYAIREASSGVILFVGKFTGE